MKSDNLTSNIPLDGGLDQNSHFFHKISYI